MRGPLGITLHSISVLFAAAVAEGGHTLDSQQQATLASWLAQHPDYRVADDTDCDCADDIAQLKTGYGGISPAAPDHHPYRAEGDFNGDGAVDFAVVVINRSKIRRRYTIVIFNGPYREQGALPSFVMPGLDLKGQGLFYGPPRPKPYHLLVGRFESEGNIFVPHGATYKMPKPALR